jgi:DnaK suppressor protein|uniref:Zinc finger DksA/TraR C4-type domain-containing protein n=1 Tax=Desulfobacca acetoxidans TaxID=60893 RepID=A0A7C5AKJ0_9BACT
MAGLTPERLAAIKERLLERKRHLWQEVKERLKNNIGNGYQEMLAAARDEEDQASVSLLAETHLTLLGPKRQELEAIEEALLRLEGGTYGLCESCGQPIEPRRLEVMPETPYCRNCMSLKEKLAKAATR